MVPSFVLLAHLIVKLPSDSQGYLHSAGLDLNQNNGNFHQSNLMLGALVPMAYITFLKLKFFIFFVFYNLKK